MELSRKIMIGMIIITGFIFLVSVTTLYVQTQITEYGFCPIPMPVLVPAFASLGVFVGSLTYYLMFIRLEESKEKRSEIIHSMLEMLEVDEKEVVKKIIENKGEIFQSKLSSLFGKVKTCRVIANLVRRGIVFKEPYGKTNKIKLNEKFRKILYT